LAAAKKHAPPSDDTFTLWRQQDWEFALQVEAAQAHFVRHNLDIIQKAAAKSRQAAAWLLERSHPQLYARPAPTIAVNKKVATNIDPGMMESIAKLVDELPHECRTVGLSVPLCPCCSCRTPDRAKLQICISPEKQRGKEQHPGSKSVGFEAHTLPRTFLAGNACFGASIISNQSS
jgi:hypothetical protein